MLSASVILSDTMRRLLGLAPHVDRRLERANLYLAGGWSVRAAAAVLAVSALSRRYNVRLYRFSGDARAVALPQDAKQLTAYHLSTAPDPAHGGSTQIGAALKRALDDAAGQQVAGAIVLSDGGNNLGDDP